jgi:signal transduction histidine kinase
MIRETLSNIAKHAGASQAWIELFSDEAAIRLTISDNGAGFEPNRSLPTEHHGLANLRSRANALGGSLQVESSLGAGSRIVAEIPLRDVA